MDCECQRRLNVFKEILLLITITSFGVHCQNVRVENVCLEVAHDAVVDCEYDIDEGESLVAVTWSRSTPDVESFPNGNLLAEYDSRDGVFIPAEHIGHINLTDTHDLIIKNVGDADIQNSRYWCRANIQGTPSSAYGDNPPSGIRRAIPRISGTTCKMTDNVYSCEPGDSLTCSANDFTPGTNFELTWICETGTAEPSPAVPDGSFFNASNVLSDLTATSENVQCTCSASGSANCNAGTLSEMVTLNVKALPDPTNKPTTEQPGSSPVRVSRETMIVIGIIGCIILAIVILVVVCLIRYKLGYRCENCKPDDPEPTTTNVTCLLEDTHSQTKDKETKCINTEENKEDKKEEDTKDNKEEVAEDNKKDNKEEEKNEKA